jgi:hypothetical protein
LKPGTVEGFLNPYASSSLLHDCFIIIALSLLLRSTLQPVPMMMMMFADKEATSFMATP